MNIYARMIELAEAERPFCAVVVLLAEGSTPREAGARAIVEPDGRIYGTVGGGAVEADTQRAAVEAWRSGRPALLHFDSTAEPEDAQPICGGAMRILVDPTAAKDVEAYRAAAMAVAQRRRGVLLTDLRGSDPIETRVTWHPEGQESPNSCRVRAAVVGGSAGVPEAPTAQLLPFPQDQTDGWVFVEPIRPVPRIFIAGGGHVGQALAAQAVLLGFDVTVIDDRREFADAALFPPAASVIHADIASTLRHLEFDDETYIVIATRGHGLDAEALRACLGRPVAYVGMIGSRRKVAALREKLLSSGQATAAQLDAVHAPIGLDLGAETPAEIALSILAEIVLLRRKGATDRCARSMSRQ